MPEMPQTIGRYQVTRALGAGAMGDVYLAEDPLLKRRLAVKTVRAHGDARELALERFKREAEISAQLNHPNVVTVYDVGEDPEAGPFLAMEFVDGTSLGRLIREGGLEIEDAIGVLIQAMRALRAAHRRAIVHRDIKPDNILLAEDGQVKLTDFGIARTMDPGLTAKGEFLGSPAYSAPELLRGEEPTPSSDRYSFAVTSFELLTGQLPHPGKTVAAVITHILQEAPVVPSFMPPRVAYIFQKALSQDPDDRYDNLPEFLMDLVDAYPLDPVIKRRVMDRFRQEDYAGDVQPARIMKARQALSQDSMPVAGSTTAAGVRSTPAPRPAITVQTGSSMKIELEPGNEAEPQRPTYRGPNPATPPPPPQKSGEDLLEPMRILKWILVLFIAGQLFWWIKGLIKGTVE